MTLILHVSTVFHIMGLSWSVTNTTGHNPGVTCPNYHSKEHKLLYHYPLYIFQCCSPIYPNVLRLEEQGAIRNDLIIKERKRNTFHQSLLQGKYCICIVGPQPGHLLKSSCSERGQQSDGM